MWSGTYQSYRNWRYTGTRFRYLTLVTSRGKAAQTTPQHKGLGTARAGRPYLHFGGFSRFPLHEGDPPAKQEDGEPLQPAEGTLQHEHHAQGSAGNL